MFKRESLIIGQLLCFIAFVVTVVVAPWSAFDPINVPKFAAISVGASVVAGAILANWAIFRNSQYRPVIIFGLAFVIDLLLVLILSGENVNQKFFGAFGRSTGFVTYVALTFLLMAAVVSASTVTLRSFVWTLIISGLLSNLYGVLQLLKLDPIDWVNKYNPVVGFLGNPNFQSSFLGFTGVAVFSMLISRSIKVIFRAGYVSYLILTAFVIKETASQQGFLVLVGGIMVVCFIWIFKSKFHAMTIPALVIGLIGVGAVTLGSLNKGPLASILYKDSVTYRGDYWRAGWKMSMDNPMFGVGLDSYGDWYRRSRTLEATIRRGPDVVSNAAHNVLLDLSSNGGFPLLIIYLFMVCLVISAAIKIVRRNEGFEPTISSLIAVWIMYQVQSIISINQIGLAVWGWIISGLVIGYEINRRRVELPLNKHGTGRKNRIARVQSESKIEIKTFMGILIGLVIGVLVGLPPLAASSNYLSALKSRDAKRVEQAAYIWPQDAFLMAQIAIALSNSNLQREALDVLEKGVVRFPDEFEMWKLLSEISLAKPEQVTQARVQMKRLDPLNPSLK